MEQTAWYCLRRQCRTGPLGAGLGRRSQTRRAGKHALDASSLYDRQPPVYGARAFVERRFSEDIFRRLVRAPQIYRWLVPGAPTGDTVSIINSAECLFCPRGIRRARYRHTRYYQAPRLSKKCLFTEYKYRRIGLYKRRYFSPPRKKRGFAATLSKSETRNGSSAASITTTPSTTTVIPGRARRSCLLRTL